jgi:hypothetical protein
MVGVGSTNVIKPADLPALEAQIQALLLLGDIMKEPKKLEKILGPLQRAIAEYRAEAQNCGDTKAAAAENKKKDEELDRREQALRAREVTAANDTAAIAAREHKVADREKTCAVIEADKAEVERGKAEVAEDKRRIAAANAALSA